MKYPNYCIMFAMESSITILGAGPIILFQKTF